MGPGWTMVMALRGTSAVFILPDDGVESEASKEFLPCVDASEVRRVCLAS